MTTAYDQDRLAAAGACFAQASRLLYCEPDRESVALQMQERLFEAAPYGMDDAFVQRGLGLMDAWCVAAAQDADGGRPDDSLDERVQGLRREWFRLFVGAGTPEAPCWESYYVEPNSQMFGKRTLDVRAAYRRHGLQIERLYAEPDDHLGLMLGFVGHLCAAEAEALADGRDADARETACEQEAFLVEHVLPWLAVWQYEVDKHAVSDYYRGAGSFVFGLCERYARRFGVAFDEESRTFARSGALGETV